MVQLLTINSTSTRLQQNKNSNSFSIERLDRTLETEEHEFYAGTLGDGHGSEEVTIKVYKAPGEGVTEPDVLKEYNSEKEAVQRLSELNLGPEFLGETNVNHRQALVTRNSYTRITDLSPEQVIRFFTGDNFTKTKDMLLAKAKEITDAGFSISNVDLAVTNTSLDNGNLPEIIFINPFQAKNIQGSEKIKETSRISDKGIHQIEGILRTAQRDNHQLPEVTNLALLAKSHRGLTSFLTHTSPTKSRFENNYIGKAELTKKINHGNSSEVFLGNIILSDGKLENVAVKILHDKYVSGRFGWEFCLCDFEQEGRNAKILEEHANGAKVYGFVDVGGNPGLVFELIKGKHSKELTKEDARDLVTDFTRRSAEKSLQELASQGYRLDDIQFFIVSEDSETRKKGEFVLTDPAQLTSVSSHSDSFNFMWGCVQEKFKTQ